MQLRRHGPLAAALAAGLLMGGTSRGEDRASTRVDVYMDDWIQVISPSLSGGFRLGEKLTVDGGYAVDVLSGATPTLDVDVVSSATTFQERRHQGDLSLTAAPDPSWSATATYTGSYEDDYRSSVGGLAASVDLLDRMATLGASYHLGRDRFGTTSGEAIEGAALTHGVKLGWTHILGRSTKGSLSLAGDYSLCEESLGCHSSPYRYVVVDDYDLGVLNLREKHPETRLRGAAALRLSQALGMAAAVHVGYRYYHDTWAIQGHTGNLTLARSLLEERLVLRADGRASWQSPASFYRDRYEGSALVPDYRSADPEMAGQTNAMLRGRAEWTWFGAGPFLELSVDGRVARLWYRYQDLETLPERDAWLLGGGLNGSF